MFVSNIQSYFLTCAGTLQILDLSDNNLEGTIPSTIGGLLDGAIVRLSGNSNL